MSFTSKLKGKFTPREDDRPLYRMDEQGRLYQVRPIHPWRWRVLWTWIIIFTAVAIVFGGVLQSQVQDVKRTKAGIHALQRTNCRQKKFLMQAYNARVRTANHRPDDADVLRQTDIAAATGYKALIDGYRGSVGANCKTPKLVPIKEP